MANQMIGVLMTSKEWLEQNPQVTREELIDELISWRFKATTYKDQLEKAQYKLAETKHSKATEIMDWIKLDPKKYYKNGELYGLIGTIEGEDGVLYIASTTIHRNAPFTKNMIKDIIMMYKTNLICLITDVKEKQGLIRRALRRYNFSFLYIDGIMYSTGGSKWQPQQQPQQ